MTESFFLLLLQKRHRAAAADLLFSSSVSLSLSLSHTRTHTHSCTHARTHGPAQVREEHTIDASTCAALTHFSRNSRTHTTVTPGERGSAQDRKKIYADFFFVKKKTWRRFCWEKHFGKKFRDFLLAFSFPMFVRDLLPRSNLIPAGNPRHPRMNKWLDANFVSQSQPNDWLIICLNE